MDKYIAYCSKCLDGQVVYLKRHDVFLCNKCKIEIHMPKLNAVNEVV